MMRKLLVRDEKGIALVMVLVLAAISLSIMSVLIYMITSGTQISGMGRKFHTALDGSYGGAQTFVSYIRDRTDEVLYKDPPFNTVGYVNFNYSVPDQSCLTQKIRGMESLVNWSSCPNYADAISVVIDSNNPNTYDMRYDYVVPGIPPITYRVFMKIAGTKVGNTGERSNLDDDSTLTADTDLPVPKSPYMYRIEVLTINIANPNDRAGISMLYAY